MAAANPFRLPRTSPTASTPKFARVKGTGVNGTRKLMRAQIAMNRLAAMTIATDGTPVLSSMIPIARFSTWSQCLLWNSA